MIELIRKNGVLYAKVLLNLRAPINYKGKKYYKGEGVLLEENIVQYLLIRNGDVRLYNGKEYVKLNFVEFRELMKKMNYKVVDYVEPKKEEPPKPEPKVEVKEQPVVKEEPKQQPVQEVKKEQPKQQNENNNKKQRHNNNNNNKQQGGDK